MRRVLDNFRPKEASRKLRDNWGGPLAAISVQKWDPYDVNSLSAIFGYLEEIMGIPSTSARNTSPKLIAAKDAPDFG